jgi:hypothetical protein
LDWRVVPAQVDPDDRVPLLRGHLRQRPVPEHPGVVDQPVEPAELAHRGLHQRVGHGHIGDVALDQHGVAAGGLDLVDHLAADRRIELVEHHRGALPRALQRLAAPDPAPGARHHDHLVVQQAHAGQPTRCRHGVARAAGPPPAWIESRRGGLRRQ